MQINTVTIVGANGTMGQNIAAIFASFGKAKVYLVSRTIEKSIQAKEKAYLSVRAESIKEKMIPVDYTSLKDCILKSDLIFEACAEEWEIKKEIHKKIAAALVQPYQGTMTNLDQKIFCSGTSGLSVTKLAEIYPIEYRHQFMGVHFFNPPYQMTLCEMTPTKYTEKNRRIFDDTVIYMADILHRTVVETSDFPAFLGNRIGFQFINEALQKAEILKDSGGIDYIDAIIGSFTGRAMPPLVTANFVGLDVHQAIVNNIYENTHDYAHETFILPDFVNTLIKEGKVGRKAGVGLYKTVLHDSGVKIHQVYDIAHGYYREKIKYIFPFSKEIVQFLEIGDYGKAFYALVNNHSQEAKICCELLIKYIIYALNTAKETGCEISAIDDVMATGFRWCPPLALLEAFELAIDFKKLCAQRLDEDIVSMIQENNLLDKIKKSKYDYRKFILAKQ